MWSGAHLVHRQVDARVWNDAQHVRDVAFIKSSQPLPSQDLLRTVRDARVLTRLSQGQASLQNLKTDQNILLAQRPNVRSS